MRTQQEWGTDSNVLPSEVKNMQGVSTEAFKRKLDRWLKMVPNTVSPRLTAMHWVWWQRITVLKSK